jgi:hypothetical protein
MVRPALAILAACGAPRGVPANARGGDDIALYRDRAIVRHRAVLDVPAGASTQRLHIAAAVDDDRVIVLDRGGLALGALHVAHRDGDDAPAELALDVIAPRPGAFAIELAYATDRLRWEASYSLATTPARDRAQLRGAVAIRDTTGLPRRAATARVIDAELGAWRELAGERLAGALVGMAGSSIGPAPARELGRIEIGPGETRVELLVGAADQAMAAVLVYDPIGTKLDRATSAPEIDPDFGVVPAPTGRLVESFSIARDERAAIGLPAGPVRLYERRGDGELAVLGGARMFDAATRVASVDTIAVGTADGVTGHRERRELTQSDKRLTEEFAITIASSRAAPVDVVVREHLYRGTNWALGYFSAPAVQEGAQQFTMTARVPARGKTELFYVVVYAWE